ncbi:unnamed protein product [Sphagnum compactum]
MAFVLSSPFRLTPRFNVPQQLNFQSVVPACCPATSGGAGAAAIDAPFPSFQLAEQHFLINGRRLTVIQPKDVDEVIDMYIEQGRLDRDPYWCRIWPSAIALAEEILAHPEHVRSLRVCDLGAGLGLAGLAAVLAGASEVVLYDREVQALVCALLTVHANIPEVATNLPLVLQPTPSESAVLDPRGCFKDVVKALPSFSKRLEQSDSGNLFGQGSLTTRIVKAELLDWTDKKAHVHNFDVVLACDVLYEKLAVPLIADLVPRLLCTHPGAKLLLADPVERNPRNREKFLQIFLESSSVQRFELEKIEEQTPHMDGSAHPVKVLHFKSV